MKKVMVVVVICLSLLSFSSAYVDLGNDHFAYNDINELVEKGITSGYPDNSFRADSYVTETELITILLRTSNLEACNNCKCWPNDYIDMAIDNGVVIDESFVTTNEFFDFMQKISILPVIKNSNDTFENSLNGKYSLLKEINKTDEYMTRAEVCAYVNRLLHSDGDITNEELPKEMEIYYSDNEELDVSTIINSIEVSEYDFYDGKYADVVDLLKNGEHRYLKGRNNFAQGKYIIAIEFDTINNSQYGVWTSYNSLILENVAIIDSFDLDEIDKQVLNLPYTATLINSNENHIVTAFYVTDNVPDELAIKRDINTIYNLQSHEYIDVNCFGEINIKL